MRNRVVSNSTSPEKDFNDCHVTFLHGLCEWSTHLIVTRIH